MKVIIYSLILIFLIGCTARQATTIKPIETDKIMLAQAKYPGYTQADFDTGKNLYETNCNTCHDLKTPKNYTEQEWSSLVPVMAEKANNKKGSSLTKEDEQLIIQYVVTASL